MAVGKPMKKHVFDLALIIVLSPLILLALSVCALAIAISDGLPVVYRSKRRVYRQENRTILKFRTMRRNAESLVNRETVAVETTRFLNIPISSPLYTPAGRLIERLMLTELPQLFHVVAGWMTLVGNRPLPENVIASLKEEFPDTEGRFLLAGGLTGPVQLIGRERISDGDRLRLEQYYCCLALESYSMMLDLKILIYTVLIGLRMHAPMSVNQVTDLLAGEAARQASIRAAYGQFARAFTMVVTLIPGVGGNHKAYAAEFLASALDRQRERLLSAQGPAPRR